MEPSRFALSRKIHILKVAIFWVVFNDIFMTFQCVNIQNFCVKVQKKSNPTLLYGLILLDFA
jgi:hypothetical protein